MMRATVAQKPVLKEVAIQNKFSAKVEKANEAT